MNAFEIALYILQVIGALLIIAVCFEGYFEKFSVREIFKSGIDRIQLHLYYIPTQWLWAVSKDSDCSCKKKEVSRL